MVRKLGRIGYVGLLACGLLSACGDDAAVPFDSIPKEKKLTELTAGEKEGTCQWVSALAREKLNPGGTPVTCHGSAVNVSGCGFPTAAQVRCMSTVGQWEACMPNFLDRIAQDPCQVLSLAFSQSELEDFVNGTPGCEGLGPCAYTIMQ